MKCVIIGNGQSRAGQSIPNYDILVGCNHAYRDFPVDYIVSIDRDCVKMIRDDNPSCIQILFDIATGRCTPPLPMPIGGFDSGRFALWALSRLRPDITEFVLWGCDMGGAGLNIYGLPTTQGSEEVWRLWDSFAGQCGKPVITLGKLPDYHFANIKMY